jgi:hypothetical protein
MVIGAVALLAAACSTQRPGLYQTDGTAAVSGPRDAIVLESRQVEVADPDSNYENFSSAVSASASSALFADCLATGNAFTAAAALTGFTVGWAIEDLDDRSYPGHEYVIKDKQTGEVFTVVQVNTMPNAWLLPPGTNVRVVGPSSLARVVPDTENASTESQPEPPLEVY